MPAEAAAAEVGAETAVANGRAFGLFFFISQHSLLSLPLRILAGLALSGAASAPDMNMMGTQIIGKFRFG
jgi:hypothetical protein